MSAKDRADPFGEDLDLSDFASKAAAKPVLPREAIRQVSEANNFPSRAAPKARAVQAPEPPAPRRRRTGRNVQFNIKATAETIERFTSISDTQNWVFGETLERALAALERELKKSKG